VGVKERDTSVCVVNIDFNDHPVDEQRGRVGRYCERENEGRCVRNVMREDIGVTKDLMRVKGKKKRGMSTGAEREGEGEERE
jgi:hypothetical protein